MIVTLQPSGLTLDIQPGERILDAARRLGFDAPQSCRNGNCHVCGATLLSGSVMLADGSHTDSGDIYTCVAEPTSDCELQWEGILAPGELPVRELACQVSECVNIGADVWRVRLRLPAGKPLRYHAGQYLLLERDGAEPAAFSIASAPQEERTLELHILNRDPVTHAVIEYLQKHRIARVQAPFGDACARVLPDQPLVLIAAGTGLAQMQSLIESCLNQGFKQPIHLYWGVRHSADFYQAPHWSQWQAQPNVHLHQVVSDQADWTGREGLLHQAICEDIADLAGYRFFVSGSPAMVYATLDALVDAGMPATQMHADAFAYAPR
ncbi:CDP-6-deoxy-delta-3,4-glucoseen reductase [Pseudomonas neustonica]|uniref:CDP-6-deoxy-delta-3,4-glucoseen reductase n=1 Tax=Pseudomonas neustonica TaxID=2487346 RepID=A0ABX9XI82_9PSED|nr:MULTISPECIES: CDP-6-deoxy-delta-3,4-glucoseen reductase [Pseudomonas]ROZ83045.1 CDP-6-deoxy-delta-3,4-glucoseen reductase [Pseudomonas sp. SSM44]ROZ84856.1 CDP-6-deoxy-delta-3,4-glucoseen reductase [Pseudomonas neustonica]|tara:strand:+ start:5728 stop:6696 length:969 start_codon:yes stop_codon:yes gene_type:complete